MVVAVVVVVVVVAVVVVAAVEVELELEVEAATFRSISGFALPSLIHNNQSLLWVRVKIKGMDQGPGPKRDPYHPIHFLIHTL